MTNFFGAVSFYLQISFFKNIKMLSANTNKGSFFKWALFNKKFGPSNSFAYMAFIHETSRSLQQALRNFWKQWVNKLKKY